MSSRKHKNTRCLLGAHFSIAKGLHNALLEAEEYGCNAAQLFTKNANTWQERVLTPTEIERFDQVRKGTGIDRLAAHTSYLINLASPDPKKHVMSCAALEQELIRSSQLQIPFVVLHPGSHMGQGEAAAIKRIAASVDAVFSGNSRISSRLLLETTAGQGSSVGHTFEQLAVLMQQINARDHIGICLDTSHIFAAGHDIRTRSAYENTMASFDRIIGLAHLYLIHLNDSKKIMGSRVDRHEHIGEGEIGKAAFQMVMTDKRLIKVPKIIETPKQKGDLDGDRFNLKRLRSYC